MLGGSVHFQPDVPAKDALEKAGAWLLDGISNARGLLLLQTQAACTDAVRSQTRTHARTHARTHGRQLAATDATVLAALVTADFIGALLGVLPTEADHLPEARGRAVQC